MKHVLILIAILSICGQVFAQAPIDQPPLIIGRGEVVNAQWTADGNTLIVASAAGLWLYDDLDAEPRFLDSRANRVHAMEMSSNGIIATGHADGSIRLWDISSGIVTQTFAGDLPIEHLAMSQDGTLIAAIHATGRWEVQVAVWDVQSGQRRYFFDHYPEINNLAISPDNQTLAIASTAVSDAPRSGTTLFDLQTGQMKGDEWGHFAVFTPDSHFVQSPINMQDEQGNYIHYFADVSFHDNWMVSANYRDDWFHDNYCLPETPFDEQAMTVWDVTTMQPIRHFGQAGAIAYRIAVHPAGEQIVTVHYDQKVQVWAQETGQLIATIGGFSGTVSELVFSPDGLTIASASEITGVKLWEASTGDELAQVTEHGAAEVVYNANGSLLAYNSPVSEDTQIGQINLWNPQTGQPVKSIDYEAYYIPHDIAFIASGNLLTWVDHDLNIWDVENNTLVWKHDSMGDYPATYDATGMRVALRYLLWDMQTGEELAELDYPEGAEIELEALDFSQDGSMIAGVSAPMIYGHSGVVVWDTQTGNVIFVNNEGFDVVAFSPDGNLLACLGKWGEIHLYDTETWNRLVVLETASWVNDLEFSPDSRFLAVADTAGLILLYQVVE